MGGERQVAHYHGVTGVLVPTSQRGSESIDGEGGRSAVYSGGVSNSISGRLKPWV